MTHHARSPSANDRLKASYDQIVAASLVRAVILHLALFGLVDAQIARVFTITDYGWSTVETTVCWFGAAETFEPTGGLPAARPDSIPTPEELSVGGRYPAFRLEPASHLIDTGARVSRVDRQSSPPDPTQTPTGGAR